jgi:2-polyprenyl-3-methyl-5-hydroxy-6-metoxy-1,4-benzoquinol methylase
MIRSVFRGSRVVRCQECGLDYMSPIPTAPEDLYEEDYFKAYSDAGMAFPTESHLHRRYRDRLSRAGALTRGRRLLEIGVGHGAFLNLAAQQHWAVTGVDVSKYAAAYVRDRYGLPVICGSIEASELSAEGYDVVHMSHVLEHLQDPIAALRRIRTLLTSGGVVAIEVPNELENLQIKLLRSVSRLPAYRVACTHVTFFTAATLRRALETAGFAPVVVRTLRDATDSRAWRRAVKHAAAVIERPLGLAPLVEALAIART